MKIPKPHLAEIGKAFLHEFIEYVDDEHFGEIRSATNRITEVAALCEEMIDFAVTKELINLGVLKDEDMFKSLRPNTAGNMSLILSQRIGSDFHLSKGREMMKDISHLTSALNEAIESVVQRAEATIVTSEEDTFNNPLSYHNDDNNWK